MYRSENHSAFLSRGSKQKGQYEITRDAVVSMTKFCVQHFMWSELSCVFSTQSRHAD